MSEYDPFLAPAKAELRRRLHQEAKSLGLTARAIDVLVARAAIVTNVRARQILCTSSDPDDFVRFVVCGCVIVRCKIGRSILIVRFLGPGRFFCVPPTRRRDGGYICEFVAHDEPVVALLTRAHLQEALATLPPSGSAQLTSAAWRDAFRLALDKAALLRMPLRARLIPELRRLVRHFGRRVEAGWTIELDLTHQLLADLVGASRAQVTKALAPLKKAGLVRQTGRRFFVSDRMVDGPAPTGGPTTPTTAACAA